MPATSTPDDEEFDVLGDFEPETDDEDDLAPLANRRRLATSAGAGLALMILTSLGFVAGVAWVVSRDVTYSQGNPLADIAIHGTIAVATGLLSGAVVLSVGLVAIGVPYARRRMAETRSRTARRTPHH